MQVPKINKIVLNIGAGEAASDSKKIQQALNDLTAIAGQKAVVTARQEGDRDLQDPRRSGRSAPR